MKNITKIMRCSYKQVSFYGENQNKIGQGAYGSVFAHETKMGRFAIKEYDRKSDKIAISINEIATLRLLLILPHKNIIRMDDIVFDGLNLLGIAMPLADYSLHNMPKDVPHVVRLSLARDMACAVDFIHMHSIVHRDIKVENFLIFVKDEKMTAVLTDFGAALVNYTVEWQKRREDMTTLWYQSPGFLVGKPYTYSDDIWSLGLVYYYLFTQSYLLTSDTVEELLIDQIAILGTSLGDQHIINAKKKYPALIASIDDAMNRFMSSGPIYFKFLSIEKQIIEKMLVGPSQARPNADSIVKDPVFSTLPYIQNPKTPLNLVDFTFHRNQEYPSNHPSINEEIIRNSFSWLLQTIRRIEYDTKHPPYIEDYEANRLSFADKFIESVVEYSILLFDYYLSIKRDMKKRDITNALYSSLYIASAVRHILYLTSSDMKKLTGRDNVQSINDMVINLLTSIDYRLYHLLPTDWHEKLWRKTMSWSREWHTLAMYIRLYLSMSKKRFTMSECEIAQCAYNAVMVYFEEAGAEIAYLDALTEQRETFQSLIDQFEIDLYPLTWTEVLDAITISISE
jgi:serine/threonine protein kinase